MKTKYTFHIGHLGAGMLATFVLLAATLIRDTQVTYADFNHNPIGVANYCRFVNGQTVVYGWAHDPDAPTGAQPYINVTVGGQTVKAPSNIAGYKDALANRYMSQERPAMPQDKTYGFSAAFSGLYKGTSYPLSGKILNYGAGTGDPSLRIDTVSSNLDGVVVNSQFNANNTLPDACLADKPAPPAPIPTPTPVPTPTPTPATPKPSGSSSSSNSNSITSAPATPAATTGQLDSADATVAAGTVSAKISVPTNGAATAHILYGTAELTITDESDEQTVGDPSTDLSLNDLEPKTNYFYQIVRTTADGTTATSPTASFKTTGYSITLHFIDAKNKPLEGLSGAINDNDSTTAKSDKNGDMSFYDLDGGSYEITYNYNKRNYSKQIDTDSADTTDADGKTLVLKDIINVSKLTLAQSKPESTESGSNLFVRVMFVLVIIALVAGIIRFLIVRRRRADGQYPVAPYTPLTPDVVDISTEEHQAKLAKLAKRKKAEPAAEPLEHVGESLREMVVRSMHEEAQKRKTPPQ